MTKRDELEAALTSAEAALAEAINAASKPNAVSIETDLRIENARACCRRARAALAELIQSESAKSSQDALDTLIKDLHGLPIRRASTRLPSGQSHEHAFRGVDRRSKSRSRQPKGTQRLANGPSAQKPGHKHARDEPSLLRQSVGFLALVLTYLLYFHIDVQLQILRLPSVFPWSLQ